MKPRILLCPLSSTSGIFNNIQSSSNSTKILLNYANDIKEIFKIFNDVKEILQLTKFIDCIKNISFQTKNLQDQIQKILVIIKDI